MKLDNHYWLKNAHIPICLLENISVMPQTREGLCHVDLEIKHGKIQQIVTAKSQSGNLPERDVKKGIIFPGFVDIHTHLDKGQIWERSPNLQGTFDQALTTAKRDAQLHWNPEDLYGRMEFGLKCAYAHGTVALRTHLDAFGEQAKMSFEVLKSLQETWQEKIIIQGVSLVSLDYFLGDAGEKLADLVAEYGEILGGVAYMNPQLEEQLDRVFLLAKERNLRLDFHADETDDPHSICLQKIAEAAIKHQFTSTILCGHCCSLALQSSERAKETLELVKAANISIVSLPMCNLYLQDRTPRQMPTWRGVTDVHKLKQANIPVAFASDNCRDPFHQFGDHDGLEVLKESVKIAHLDTPYEDWAMSVNKTPADIMELPQVGRIGTGKPADLVIFKGRYFSELFARPQSDRLVLRQGKLIETTLPDYAELDKFIGLET